MNREIKFRGKRLDNGIWIYGDLMQHQDGDVYIGDNTRYWTDDGYHNNGYEEVRAVDDETIGQFTGLHDRTGKEVYEGDVVFWIAIDMRGRGKGEQGAIIWDKQTMSWAIMRDKPTSDGRPCIISRPFGKKHLEVVGNIHDNPELMKGGTV